MNYMSNHDDSRQDQPILSFGSSKSKPEPVVKKNEESPEVAEEDLASNHQPFIHSVRFKPRNQSNMNPPEMTALDLEPQNGVQEIKLAEDDENHHLSIPSLSNDKIFSFSKRFDSQDKLKEKMKGEGKLFVEDSQPKNQSDKFSPLTDIARRFHPEIIEEEREAPEEKQLKKSHWRSLKRCCKKKRKEENLPEGMGSVAKLKELYEKKRHLKKISHLNCIPEAHQGLFMKIEENLSLYLGGINCVMFSPNRQLIISGSDDFSIKVFDAETKQEVYHIKEAHENPVKLLAITSDGEYLASVSDKSLNIWRFSPEPKTLLTFRMEEHSISLLDIADNRNIFYGFVFLDTSFIKLFDVRRRGLVFTTTFGKRGKSLKAVSDRHAVLLTEDGSIVILNLESGKSESLFEANDFVEITSITIKPGTTISCGLVIAGCDNGSVKIFDIANRNLVKDLIYEYINMIRQPRNNPVKQIVSSADGGYLFIGFQDGSIQMRGLWNSNENKTLQEKGYEWDQIVVSRNRDFLIACSRKLHSIMIIDIEAEKKNIFSLQESRDDEKISFSISRDGQFILFATSAPELQLFNPETRKKFGSAFKFEKHIACLALSPDTNYIIIGFEKGSLETFFFEKKEQEPKFFHNYGKVLNFFSPIVAVTEDSRYIIAVSENTSFKILDIKEKKEVHTFVHVHDELISCLTGTPDSKFIVSASYDKSIKIFDIATAKEVYHFKEVHNGAIFSVAVTPNNKFLLSASGDLSIKIFDLETKHQIHEFAYSHDEAPLDPIMSLSISSDSRYVASGSADHSVKIFDIETKQLVSYLRHIHDKSVTKVVFAPNNKYLVSMSVCGSMNIISFETSMEEKQFQCKQFDKSECISFVGPGKLEAVLNRNNQLIFVILESDGLHGIEMETGKEVFKIKQHGNEAIKSVAVSLDSSLLIYGTTKGRVCVFDIEENEMRFLKCTHKNKKTVVPVTAVAITCDNKFGISASSQKVKVSRLAAAIHSESCLEGKPNNSHSNSEIRVENFENEETYHKFSNPHQDFCIYPRDPCYSISVIPKSQFIILSSGDKSIKILDIENKNQVYDFENAHRRPIKCVAVTGDGRFLVSGSDDRSIKVFDFKTKQLVHWFQNAHDDVISSLAVSTYNGCSIIVSGSLDKSIKVFDLQTRQQIHHFRKIHTGDIKFVKITSNNQYVISACSDDSIKVLKLIPTSPLPNQVASSQDQSEFRVKSEFNGPESEITYVYNGFSHYSNFNAVDDFLFDMNIPTKLIYDIAMRCPALTVYPYRWNILHLVAIRAQDAFLKNMPEYSEFKVPFLLDTFFKTPLHYLFDHDHINFTYANNMLNYICDYLDDLDQDQSYQTQEIIISMVPLLWFILEKNDVKIRARFFNLCSTNLPLPYNTELPPFGKMKTDAPRFCPTLESIYNSKDDIWQDGEDQVNFRSSFINLDYYVLSSDMKKAVKFLSKQKDEDIFQTTLIIDLIDFLWDQTKLFLRIEFFVFSAYIIALSVYLSREDRSLAYEIVILLCSASLLFVEGLQFFNSKPKRDYFRDYWNYIDIVFHPLTMGYIIARIAGLNQELVRAWFSSIILLLGYLRWISFLRVFEPTRSLIEVIVTVVKDMWSFIVIIALIIIGFSFIFLVFRRGRLYGFYLYNSYSSLYGPLDEEDYTPSPSELFFIALIAFLLNVILLNLLIAIMSDSYVKVLDKRIKADSLTRLDMISEAVAVLRHLRFIRFHKLLRCLRCKWCLRRFECLEVNKHLNRGFLVRCKSLSSVNADEDKWEGRIKVFRKLFQQSQNSTKNEIKNSQQDLQQCLLRIDQTRKAGEERLEEKITTLETRLQTKFEEKITTLESRLQAELEKMRNDQNEKIDKMLALLTEINQQRAAQPNVQELQ